MTIYDIVADPTRRRILDLLRMRPHLVGELVDDLKISQPGVSKQLRILRETGLVDVRQDGQRRWYELRPEPLAELDEWLDPYRSLWDERFQKLDDYLRKIQQEEQDDGKRTNEDQD